jgi:hypothetical protein
MARKPLKHELEAHRRVAASVNQRTQGAVDASRARGNPALAIYGRGGPRGGPESSPAQRPPERATLTPADVQKIEHALGGPKAHAVLAALKQAGLVGGGPRSAPPQRDRGALSPLGGSAV